MLFTILPHAGERGVGGTAEQGFPGIFSDQLPFCCPCVHVTTSVQEHTKFNHQARLWISGMITSASNLFIWQTVLL